MNSTSTSTNKQSSSSTEWRTIGSVQQLVQNFARRAGRYNLRVSVSGNQAWAYLYDGAKLIEYDDFKSGKDACSWLDVRDAALLSA